MPMAIPRFMWSWAITVAGEVKTITAFWEDARGELVSVDRRADEIEVRIDGSKKTFEISTRAEFVYKLSAAADEDDYKEKPQI